MLPDDPGRRNRASWNARSDEYQQAHGEQLAAAPLAWGVWRIPETELQVLGDVAGRDVLEFGCGAAQWSIGLARQGARVVGLDLSERQLAHARRDMATAGVEFPLVQASGAATPFRSASFDVVFCDHGATTFAPPEDTVAEASRLLRPGGRFAFCMTAPLVDVCWDEKTDRVSDRLVTDYFQLHRLEDRDQVFYQLPYGRWIRLFRRHALQIEDLIELRPPRVAETSYQDFVPLAWARRWPAEHIWNLTRV